MKIISKLEFKDFRRKKLKENHILKQKSEGWLPKIHRFSFICRNTKAWIRWSGSIYARCICILHPIVWNKSWVIPCKLASTTTKMKDKMALAPCKHASPASKIKNEMATKHPLIIPWQCSMISCKWLWWVIFSSDPFFSNYSNNTKYNFSVITSSSNSGMVFIITEQ